MNSFNKRKFAGKKRKSFPNQNFGKKRRNSVKAKRNYAQNSINSTVSVRTLHIAPIKPEASNELKEYFKKFGEVESIEVHRSTNQNVHFGFVQFKMVKAARMALKSKHHIAGCDIEIKAAYPWQQPDHILNALDNDLLKEIFQYLDPLELSVVADVCVRFNQQAKQVFASKYKDLIIGDYSTVFNRNGKLEGLLRNFGSEIMTLIINSVDSCSDVTILRWINQYCTSKLKGLGFINFEFDRHWMKHRAIFAQLDKLAFTSCEFTDKLKGFFAECVQLKMISIEKCFFLHNKCIVQKFVNLDEAKICGNYGLDNAAFNGFITLNSTITKLWVVDNDNSKMEVSKTICSIGENLPHLMELNFCHATDQDGFTNDYNTQRFHKSMQSISHLNSLKVLKFNFNMELSIAPFMKSLADDEVPIEHLKVSCGCINAGAAENIVKMKHLKILEIVQMVGFTDEHMLELAKGLPGLQELHFDGLSKVSINGLKEMLTHANQIRLLTLNSMPKIKIDVDDYKTMLKIVEKRPENIELVIKLTGRGGQVDIPTLNENRDRLYISEEVQIVDDFAYSIVDLMDAMPLLGIFEEDVYSSDSEYDDYSDMDNYLDVESDTSDDFDTGADIDTEASGISLQLLLLLLPLFLVLFFLHKLLLI